MADECWVALARLHREHPQQTSFTAREILARVVQMAHGPLRSGVQPHIYLHNVANLAPNSATYRMFYKMAAGTYRLFRPGDEAHPARKGKITPELSELPPEYHELLAWYEQVYCRQAGTQRPESDPVLKMLGVGQELWTEESGDQFVARERQAWDDRPSPPAPLADLTERVWQRLKAHQGETFYTKSKLPFRYEVKGNGIWFFRDGEKVNRRLDRGDVKKALARCPLDKVTDVRACQDPSYLFGVLTDERIQGEDW